MSLLNESNKKSATNKLSKFILIGIMLPPVVLFFGFIISGILSFSPGGGNIDPKEIISKKNQQLIILFIKQQKSGLLDNNRFLENDDKLLNLKEEKNWLETQGYQIEVQSDSNSSIITSRDKSSTNEKFFGVIKIVKTNNIKKSRSQNLEGLSFICISKQNVPLPSKIELANIASVATSPAKNNCPVGYIQKYQDTF
jgi:hypothetical protein